MKIPIKIEVIDSDTLYKKIKDSRKHNKEIMRHISEDKYLEWMNEFFHQNDEKDPEGYSEWISFLMEEKDNGTLSSTWNAMIDGRLGMHVRNYMREHHPIIDVDFQLPEDQIDWEDETFLDYAAFEDYSWELINKLLEKIEKGEIN